MVIKFKFIDKIIIFACIVVMAICWVFLSDLNYLRDNRNDSEKIGRININKGQDVRKKIGSDYFWQNIKGLNNIYNGDSFYSGKSSSAVIDLDDGTTLQLKENSSIKFNNKKNKLSIDIVFGQVRVNAKTKSVTINDCSKDIQIDSLNASFDIEKGTECGDVQIKVKTGRIKLANQIMDTNSKTESLNLKNRASLDRVLKFMDRPQNVKAYIRMSAEGGLEFAASWDLMTKAADYELEISPDPELKIDMKNYHVKTNSFILPNVVTEQLYYRLRANASDEKLGEFGAVSLAVVKESLETPQIQNTELKTASHKDLSLSLNWLPLVKASQYHVEISDTPDFAKIIEQEVKEARTSFSGLEKTALYVRARAENKYAKSKFSEPVYVTLTKENIPPPQIKSTDFETMGQDELALNLNLQPQDKISQYQVEISETPDFIKPLAQIVKKPSARFSDLQQTAMYVRARAENKFGKSNFSEPILAAFKYEAQSNPDKILSDECKVLNHTDTGLKKDFTVDWQPVPMAQEYTVKIMDNKKSSQVSQVRTRGPASTVTIPACGEYDINVEAFDKGGRKISSEFNATKIIYKTTLVLLKPIISDAQKNLNIFFQKGEGRFVWLKWLATVKPDSLYRVEMATDINFTENYKKFDVKDNKLLLKSTFQNDTYFWRVREQKPSLFSEWSETAQIKINVKNPDN